MTSLPKGWPVDDPVQYSPKYIWSPSISKPTFEFMNQVPSQSSSEALLFPTTPHQNSTRKPSSKVKIKKIMDKGHPAFGQCGLFAAENLPADSFILDYVGQVVLDSQASQTSDYTMSFIKGLSGNIQDLAIDAEKVGNEARFINDFRGIAQEPNAKFENYRNTLGKVCVGVWVLKRAGKIKKGDEITVSYGKGFWANRRTSS